MIRINLITTKRRKPIQIPFAAIFLVIALAGILVGFYLGTMALNGYNDDLLDEKKKLEDDVKANKGKLDQRDNLDQKRRDLKVQIEQLKQLSGADLLQWSEVFNSLTTVVPEKTVWITNLRIDTDRRVQITGYACHEDGQTKGNRLTLGIQQFLQQLQGHSNFSEIFLSNANKNTYEKAPVWRFDISCRIKRDISR